MVDEALDVNGVSMKRGDGPAVDDEPELIITVAGDSEFLVFDLASSP